MRISLVFFFLIFLAFSAESQDYLITFSASGAASHIDQIEVQNLNTRQTLILDGSEALMLISGENLKANETTPELTISPNMHSGSCEINLTINFPGNSSIKVYDASSHLLAELNLFLNRGTHQFLVSELKPGAHKLKVSTPNHDHSHWIMSSAQHRNTAVKIIPTGKTAETIIAPLSANPVSMAFKKGERLLFKGISDDYSRLKPLTPQQNANINFHFIPCMDVDENHYSIVSIGEQIWMAENLRTTKFNDGTEIRHIQNSLLWRELRSPAYSWYEHNQNYSAPHGALYNWHTVSDNRLCPSGWRMPSDEDWYQLENFIDPEINNPTATGWRGVNAGHLLKSVTGWRNYPGNNHYGFSATPSGRRSFDGTYNSMGEYTYWWSLSELNEATGWSRYTLPRFDYMYRGAFYKTYGFSVRCIKK